MNSRLRATFVPFVPLVLASVLSLAFGAAAILAPPAVSGLQTERSARVPGPSTIATTCQTGPRYGVGGVEIFDRIPGAGPGVALTFDMNGSPERSMEIMQILVELEACSTIFLDGAASSTSHGQQVMATIAAHPHLFEVGNHTMHHCNLLTGSGSAPCPGTPPSAAFIQQELMDAADIIRAGTGLEPIPYWRPPYGAFDSFVLEAAAGAGYTKTFHWDIDTSDWMPPADGGPSTEDIVNNVLANAREGSNVLFHLSGWNTAEALGVLVPELRARGLLPTTLSHLLAGVEEAPPDDEIFQDIGGSMFYEDILWAYENGITAGCTPELFCPSDPVNRDQMASFLVRALGLTEGGDITAFTDTSGNQHEADINRLAHAGITRGCGGGRFCPSGLVSRDQMASFLVRAYGLTEGGDITAFTDTSGNQHEADINRLAHAGITRGCTANRYCPGNTVNRDQMTAFLRRASP